MGSGVGRESAHRGDSADPRRSSVHGLLDDPAVRAAIAKSVFAELPRELTAKLLAGASRFDVPAGAIFVRHGTAPPSVYLVIHGLGRTFLASPTGRQATIRYFRPGEVIGSALLFEPREHYPVGAQCLVDSTLLLFSLAVARDLATSDVRVTKAFAHDMALRLIGYFRELDETTFGTVRQRLARHLLHVAAEHQRGPALVVTQTQQQLADAVGSVREVVARILGELRRDGLVRTETDGIVIADASRLEAEGWNPEA